MKKLYVSALIAGAIMMSCQAARVNFEKIDELIAASSLGRLKSVLKKLDRQPMKKQVRMKAYYSFYDDACELVDQRKESMWIFGCWQDAAKTVGGSLLGLGGIMATTFGFAFSRPDNSDHQELFCSLAKAGGIVAAPIGIFLLYKGITCSTQRSRYQDAQEIESFLDNRIIELEKPVAQEAQETKDTP